MNTQFVFEGKQKTILLSAMLLGLACLGLTWVYDDEYHTRFWTNVLHNSVFLPGFRLLHCFSLQLGSPCMVVGRLLSNAYGKATVFL